MPLPHARLPFAIPVLTPHADVVQFCRSWFCVCLICVLPARTFHTVRFVTAGLRFTFTYTVTARGYRLHTLPAGSVTGYVYHTIPCGWFCVPVRLVTLRLVTYHRVVTVTHTCLFIYIPQFTLPFGCYISIATTHGYVYTFTYIRTHLLPVCVPFCWFYRTPVTCVARTHAVTHLPRLVTFLHRFASCGCLPHFWFLPDFTRSACTRFAVYAVAHILRICLRLPHTTTVLLVVVLLRSSRIHQFTVYHAFCVYGLGYLQFYLPHLPYLPLPGCCIGFCYLYGSLRITTYTTLVTFTHAVATHAAARLLRCRIGLLDYTPRLHIRTRTCHIRYLVLLHCWFTRRTGLVRTRTFAPPCGYLPVYLRLVTVTTVYAATRLRLPYGWLDPLRLRCARLPRTAVAVGCLRSLYTLRRSTVTYGSVARSAVAGCTVTHGSRTCHGYLYVYFYVYYGYTLRAPHIYMVVRLHIYRSRRLLWFPRFTRTRSHITLFTTRFATVVRLRSAVPGYMRSAVTRVYTLRAFAVTVRLPRLRLHCGFCIYVHMPRLVTVTVTVTTARLRTTRLLRLPPVLDYTLVLRTRLVTHWLFYRFCVPLRCYTCLRAHGCYIYRTVLCTVGYGCYVLPFCGCYRYRTVTVLPHLPFAFCGYCVPGYAILPRSARSMPFTTRSPATDSVWFTVGFWITHTGLHRLHTRFTPLLPFTPLFYMTFTFICSCGFYHVPTHGLYTRLPLLRCTFLQFPFPTYIYFLVYGYVLLRLPPFGLRLILRGYVLPDSARSSRFVARCCYGLLPDLRCSRVLPRSRLHGYSWLRSVAVAVCGYHTFCRLPTLRCGYARSGSP